MLARESEKLCGYGVWRVPALVEGGLMAIWAVDSFGVIQKVRTIRADEDPLEVSDRLFAWLREHHPPRRVELVRDTPPIPLTRYQGRVVDPALLSDPRSPIASRRYRDRLVKRAAQKAGIIMFRTGR